MRMHEKGVLLSRHLIELQAQPMSRDNISCADPVDPVCSRRLVVRFRIHTSHCADNHKQGLTTIHTLGPRE
jgi:hypothetical protein